MNMSTNEHDQAHKPYVKDQEHPGYETTDINVRNIIVFLGSLVGFLLVFFVFCYIMGRTINNSLAHDDGPVDKWHEQSNVVGGAVEGKREDLTSNAVMEQRSLQQVTGSFPQPRLEMDDGNQDITDLHAREDLLLDNYSTVLDSKGASTGAVRIPIEQAMKLIAQRGMPVAPLAKTSVSMAGDSVPVVQAPLTTGFARTGYELQAIEEREQRLELEHPEAKK
jgi:hypothetical protein